MVKFSIRHIHINYILFIQSRPFTVSPLKIQSERTEEDTLPRSPALSYQNQPQKTVSLATSAETDFTAQIQQRKMRNNTDSHSLLLFDEQLQHKILQTHKTERQFRIACSHCHFSHEHSHKAAINQICVIYTIGLESYLSGQQYLSTRALHMMDLMISMC